ncbi:MAG: helix-turn-helix domain-containing protein [Coriobacteriales bacterium]
MTASSIDRLTSCMLTQVLSKILGGKWKPFIIWYLSLQPDRRARYGELKKIIPYKISDKMFSQHLNELEEEGIVERLVVEEKPLWVDYFLTTKGISLANLLYLIRDWGVVHCDFSVDALKRTKGVINEGKLEYGINDDEHQRSPHEKYIWHFDSTYDEDDTAQ